MTNPIYELQQYFARRRTAYVKTFANPFGEEVLRDLAKFCRAHDTTFKADPREHALLEGRREVWLRIQEHIQFSDQEIWNLHQARNPNLRASDN